MPRMCGRVLTPEGVVCAEGDLWLSEWVDPASGHQDWQGALTVPPGRFFALDAPYRLELADGRAGAIRITHLEMGGSVEFVGVGELT